jgi:hypothetical protein
LVVGTAVVLGILGRPILTGEVRTATDLGNFFLPARAFYANALAEGFSFFWWPNQFTGFHLHGEGQAGLLHPLNWLQYRWLSLEAALGWELLRSYAFALAGGFWMLRRFGLTREAAGFGAFTFGFSGFALLHYVHPQIVGAVAHLPFAIVALTAIFRPRTRLERSCGPLALVVVTASQAMMGHPQILWTTGLVEAVVALALARSVGSLRGLVDAGVAKCLGVGAAAAALLPVWESLAGSFRAAPPSGFTGDFAIAPLGLVQLVAPYLFDGRVVGESTEELALYLGAVPLVLLVWLAARFRQLGDFRGLVLFTSLVAFVSGVLSLGDAGWLYRLQELLPVVGLFRAPARYSLVLSGACTVLAAVAWMDLVRGEVLVGRRAALLFAPAALGWVVAFAVPALSDEAVSDSALARLAGPLLLTLAGALVWATAAGWRGAGAALVTLSMLDLAGYGLSHVERSPPMTVDAFLARFELPARPGHDRLHWGAPAVTMSGLRIAGGYASMTPDRVLDLGTFGEPLELDTRLANALRISGVRWAIGTRLPPPLPRARLVASARVSTDPSHDVGVVDVETTALVGEPVELDAGAPGRADWRADDPGDLQLAVTVPGRQLLVVSESFHPGWRVEIDEQPARVLRVYGDYLGCVVESGHHEVRFRFEPDSLCRGAVVSALALGLALVWTSLRFARGRR